VGDGEPPPNLTDRAPGRLPRSERRAQIIETAAGAFLQAGFEGTSMEGVARRAGVSRLLVYRVFETKRHLYRAVLGSVTDEFIAEFATADMGDIQRRGGIVTVMLGIARRHPDAFRLLWRQAANEPAFVEFARNFRQVLYQYAELMIARVGKIDDPTMVHWCATALASHLLDGMCAWLDDGEPARDREYIVLQVCSLFAMIEAWGDPHPPPWIPVPDPPAT
jgi:AcrR family transcriptional regulator